MIGRLLCKIGLHRWKYDGNDPIPKYCACCGWGALANYPEPITSPDDCRLRGRPFYQCHMFLKLEYPVLAEPFRLLQTEPLWKVADWLNEHFPLKEGQWGTRLVVDLYRDLRAQTEGKI